MQLEHHLGQALMRYLIFDLLFVGLGNLIVLAVDASQIAVTEEDVSRAARAGQRGLFAKMRRVRRHDWQPPRIAGGNLIFQSVVETIARTDRASFEEAFE